MGKVNSVKVTAAVHPITAFKVNEVMNVVTICVYIGFIYLPD